MLKPMSTNTKIFDSKNEKFEVFEYLFPTMLKMQPELMEAFKKQFPCTFAKKALQTIRNISSSNKKLLMTC